MPMKIAVIGAGPAGMAFALAAARGGETVTLYEQKEALGRKLLVTGSGRCNLSNHAVSAGVYTCPDPSWLAQTLEAMPPEALLATLDGWGIPSFATPDGWVYPLSESAGAVVAILEEQLRNAGVILRVATRVKRFERSRGGGGWKLDLDGPDAPSAACDHLVLASGGRAYPRLGSDGALFPLLRELGHTVRPPLPALGPIYAELGAFAALKGQRFDARTAIYAGEELLGSSEGNLIVIAEGFNGPGVMNLSHLVGVHGSQALSLSLDLLGTRRKRLEQGLMSARCSLGALLSMFFAPKAVPVLLQMAGLQPHKHVGQLNMREGMALVKGLSDLRFKVSGAGNFENSQVKVGGVAVNEVHPVTMRSLKLPELSLVGEVLDVAGPCGGYNLHFAFASGILAGKAFAAPGL